MNAHTTDLGDIAQVTELVRLAVERVDLDPNAGTRKYSQTTSVRKVTNALRAIGLPRTAFSVRNPCDRRTGEYKGAMAFLRGDDAHELVVRYADALGSELGVTLCVLPSSGRTHAIVSSNFVGVRHV